MLGCDGRECWAIRSRRAATADDATLLIQPDAVQRSRPSRSAAAGLALFAQPENHIPCGDCEVVSSAERMPQRKNPPRISADGFRAEQFTLDKTPCFTGPVKQSSNLFCTRGKDFAGRQLLLTASYAGLTRVSITLRKSLGKRMDHRVKPGDDAEEAARASVTDGAIRRMG
jgi:hypothetical protein